MRRDENGIAMPGVADGLPWKPVQGRQRHILDRHDAALAYDGDTDRFIAHVANYHARLADIVRRISDWLDGDLIDDIGPTMTDAAKLWSEMKGGGE